MTGRGFVSGAWDSGGCSKQSQLRGGDGSTCGAVWTFGQPHAGRQGLLAEGALGDSCSPVCGSDALQMQELRYMVRVLKEELEEKKLELEETNSISSLPVSPRPCSLPMTPRPHLPMTPRLDKASSEQHKMFMGPRLLFPRCARPRLLRVLRSGDGQLPGHCLGPCGGRWCRSIRLYRRAKTDWAPRPLGPYTKSLEPQSFCLGL